MLRLGRMVMLAVPSIKVGNWLFSLQCDVNNSLCCYFVPSIANILLTLRLSSNAEIRKVLSKYVVGELPEPPPLPPRTAYGEVTMKAMGSIFDVLKVVSTPPGGIKLEWPVPMERLRQVIYFLSLELLIVCRNHKIIRCLVIKSRFWTK